MAYRPQFGLNVPKPSFQQQPSIQGGAGWGENNVNYATKLHDPGAGQGKGDYNKITGQWEKNWQVANLEREEVYRGLFEADRKHEGELRSLTDAAARQSASEELSRVNPNHWSAIQLGQIAKGNYGPAGNPYNSRIQFAGGDQNFKEFSKLKSKGLSVSDALLQHLNMRDRIIRAHLTGNPNQELSPNNASLVGGGGGPTSFGDGTGGASGVAYGANAFGEDGTWNRNAGANYYEPGGGYDLGGGAEAFRNSVLADKSRSTPSGYRGASKEYLDNIKTWNKQPNNLYYDKDGGLFKREGNTPEINLNRLKGDTVIPGQAPDGKYYNWNWGRENVPQTPVNGRVITPQQQPDFKAGVPQLDYGPEPRWELGGAATPKQQSFGPLFRDKQGLLRDPEQTSMVRDLQDKFDYEPGAFQDSSTIRGNRRGDLTGSHPNTILGQDGEITIPGRKPASQVEDFSQYLGKPKDQWPPELKARMKAYEDNRKTPEYKANKAWRESATSETFPEWQQRHAAQDIQEKGMSKLKRNQLEALRNEGFHQEAQQNLLGGGESGLLNPMMQAAELPNLSTGIGVDNYIASGAVPQVGPDIFDEQFIPAQERYLEKPQQPSSSFDRWPTGPVEAGQIEVQMQLQQKKQRIQNGYQKLQKANPAAAKLLSMRYNA